MISYNDTDNTFIFNSLIKPKIDILFNDTNFIFTFHILPTIIFITTLINLLYYINVIKLLIHILNNIFQKTLNINKIESFIAITTIFLKQNKIPTIVKPFIDHINRNELFTAIYNEITSITNSIIINYTEINIPINYLLTTSLITIPNNILFTHILNPTTEPSQITFKNLSFNETPPKNFIETTTNDTITKLKIAANITTIIITFIAIITLINNIIDEINN